MIQRSSIKINRHDIPVYSIKTLVIGSGCAGLNAIDWLYDLGQRDIALVTEGINMGTSRNTGSDKQTYYKLSLASGQPDSIDEMARTLYDGGAVNGDTALIEAACSVQSFFKLANLGVPFPTNQYGEYVGYKTDHDPRQRATSAGPLTSRYMTQVLEKAVRAKGVSIMDGIQVVQLMKENDQICGALALDINKTDQPNRGWVLFRCANVVLATGGPAGIYHNSVYPASQTGMTGMALEVGADAANLQEWQYGLSSVAFRWNVSGTYQQVLPRYISIDREGVEREFLNDYFDDPFEAVNRVFLKGYQWPFDTAKINGSSMIDIIVHHETVERGNKVYMDFTRNPSCIDGEGLSKLSSEAYTYLENSDALLNSPLQRLQKMNQPAIDLYTDHGIDLSSQPLEVRVCAQHCNGGIAVDSDWQSSVQGLYAVGEAAGTFGSYRPGGSALNSTQVGAMRAAQHITFSSQLEVLPDQEYYDAVTQHSADLMDKVDKLVSKRHGVSINREWNNIRMLMSRNAAHIRNIDKLEQTSRTILALFHQLFAATGDVQKQELPLFFKYRDSLITQSAVLSAMKLASTDIGSRGSGLVLSKDGMQVSEELPEYDYMPTIDGSDKVLITRAGEHDFSSDFVNRRPIPKRQEWFENVWNEYKRERRNNGYIVK